MCVRHRLRDCLPEHGDDVSVPASLHDWVELWFGPTPRQPDAAALQRVPEGLRWSADVASFPFREAFDAELAEAVAAVRPDWIVCAVGHGTTAIGMSPWPEMMKIGA